MKEKHLVSIIMPTFNSSKYIIESINSVLNQTYRNTELIVINDNSTDETKSIVEEIKKKDTRIILINNIENLGVAKSRNIGINLSKGRFIAFLDSDDLWDKQKLELQINSMLKNNWSFTYCSYRKINNKGEYIKDVKSPKKLNYYDILKTCYIGCLTVVIDNNYFDNIKMPTSSLREDYLTWLQLLKKTPYAFSISSSSLASYRVHTQQNSRKKLKMAKENWRIYKNIEKLGLLKSIYYFVNYASIGLIRKYF